METAVLEPRRSREGGCEWATMRNAPRIVVILCALGSLASTLYAGHHNRSNLLVAMFAAWVVAPFLGLLGALRCGERGTAQAATILRLIALIVSLAALALFSAFALRPITHHAAAPFLLVPVCMWAATAGMFIYGRRYRTQIPR